jgi:hypothetical protein
MLIKNWKYFSLLYKIKDVFVVLPTAPLGIIFLAIKV